MAKNSNWGNIRIVKKANFHFEVQLEYGHIYTNPIGDNHVWKEWELDNVFKTLPQARNRKRYLVNLTKEGEVIE